ncbi:glycosyltransferase family 4 protein [Luteococcus japonicus]|uniref:Phosphatidylinositol alpha-mannosyltransferase n=1 Tax=Luteococcus japonicus LSP_Lj1 TaxID=1255658 RepID=A0A1R4K414_9ACTN|nr:glycosyltransferase family 4 protein [Luteococcus japonicus]SJN39191.1 Phosphatidylinositol alpha-mannosyltransferase [Luteococcus japonicus LSP_Lj1]
MNDCLRVGLVCPYSFARAGGVQNHVLGLAGWLRSQGHSVSILAPGRPTAAMLHGAGLGATDFTSAGPAIPVSYNGSVARINFGPAAALRVRDWLKHGHFDLVHVHEPMTPSISLLALGRARVPLVATFHTATPGSRTMGLAYQLLPQAAERIDRSIAVSRTAARVAEAHGGPRSTVIGNAISVREHPLAECTARWRAGDHPRVTFVGRYDEPRKGLTVLLDALPVVRRRHPDLRVQVVGAGTARRTAGVQFTGPLDDRGRNEALATSDAYVAPHTGRESFGIVLLEALASGAPVVASDLPAFREVVSDEHGPVADLFRPGDPQALAEALLTSLARPRGQWERRGRRRAEAFDWSVVGPQVLEVYRNAAGSASSAAPRGRSPRLWV